MFNKLSLLALATPLVSALTLNIPSNPTSGGSVTISWTSTPTDPPFSLELVNEQFHNSFAIANNVQPGQQSIDLTLPIVPVGDGYKLEAVNIGDINQAFSTTGDFAIGPNADSSVSASQASTSAGATSLSAPSASVTGHTSLPVSFSLSHSAFGSTVTSPSVSPTGSASSTAQSSPAATTLTGGASFNYKFSGNKGTMAAVLLSALAGAAIVVL